ncbi:histidine kinase [Amycolatopsis sp. Hca4]|uniref:sensor histidine kinase n=1 Tax=unclassified Amycolatopsis TaxID=2618356 RepID=UPI00159119B8|nr:histidine kinase [Amycolatopsis sp. Hca4]QKV75146.1 sensor histidine kinase [Amycolatopsis sp. Hca4]
MHAGVCFGIGLLGLLGPLREVRSWPVSLAAAGYAVALVAVHLVGFGYGRIRFRGPALVLQAVLGLVPVLQLGVAWSVLSSFFVGSVLLVARPVVSLPVLVVVSSGVGLLSADAGAPGESVPDGLHGAALTAVAAVAVFGLAWFVRLAAEREHGRRTLAAQVVAEERMRFARDTHDLLGLSLSAITLKVELVRRLVDTQPAQAQQELTELVTMSRKALADVRSVAAGHRELSLADECAAAAAVLTSAGVTVRFDRVLPDQLPEAVATTFATVLRESVTNVVRHSKASWCEFAIGADRDEAWLRVANDGVLPGGSPECGEERGWGLRNLEHRVGLLGGELTAGTQPGGTHLLHAGVPLAPFGVRRGFGPLRAIRRQSRS